MRAKSSRHLPFLALVAVLAVPPLAAACSSAPDGETKCGASDKIDRTADLDLQDSTGGAVLPSYKIDVNSYGPGQKKDLRFDLSNVASTTTARPLTIVSVTVHETDAAGVAVTTPHFACLGPDDTPCDKVKWPEVIPVGFDASCAAAGALTKLPVTLRYTRPAQAEVRQVELRLVVQGDPDFADAPLVVRAATSLGDPKLNCGSNTLINFGKVGAGAEPMTHLLQCTNTGNADLVLSKLEILTTGMPLTVAFGDVKATPQAPYVGEPKTAVPPGGALQLEVVLASLAAEEKLTATVKLHTNDPAKPTASFQFAANTTGPCLKVEPALLQFGEVPVGQVVQKGVLLCSCGTEDVQVTGAALDPETTSGFELGFTGQCFAEDVAPSADKPLAIPPNECCQVEVRYAPAQSGAEGTGKVVVATSGGDTKYTDLQGKGVAVSCPTACVTASAASGPVVSGGAVIPQTKLTLDGTCSQAGAGQVIDKYKWKVIKQPPGSYALPLPTNPSHSIVTLTPNLAGQYTVQLDVTDDTGASACQPLQFALVVVPDDKLHIELTWDTPGDTDPDDGKGTDLDLHLAHPLATEQPGQQDYDKNGEPDPWNAPCYDCFLLNGNPKKDKTDWGDLNETEDDASLDLDDKDGFGPENVNLPVPEKGVLYHVGVFAWSTKGFAGATPQIKIFLDGALAPAYVKTGPPMITGDMWCVGRVGWSPNQYQPCKGADGNGHLLTHKYPIPLTTGLGCL